MLKSRKKSVPEVQLCVCPDIDNIYINLHFAKSLKLDYIYKIIVFIDPKNLPSINTL